MEDLYKPERREGMNILSAQVATLHTDVTEIKHSLKDLTTAINKLAVVEERLTNSNHQLTRLFEQQQRIDARIDVLEQKMATSSNTTKWVDRGIMGILGVFLVFVWEKFLDHH